MNSGWIASLRDLCCPYVPCVSADLARRGAGRDTTPQSEMHNDNEDLGKYHSHCTTAPYWDTAPNSSNTAPYFGNAAPYFEYGPVLEQYGAVFPNSAPDRPFRRRIGPMRRHILNTAPHFTNTAPYVANTTPYVANTAPDSAFRSRIPKSGVYVCKDAHTRNCKV